MSELGIFPNEIAFEEFRTLVNELDKRKAEEDKKPKLAMFTEVKPEEPGEKSELVLEIDTKTIDILK